MASVLYHLSKNKTIGILDKICIAGVVLQGGKITFLDSDFDTYSLIVITTGSSVVWLYHYGFRHQMYVFDKDAQIGNNYHTLLHVISSIGHHAVACKMRSTSPLYIDEYLPRLKNYNHSVD